MLEVFFKHIIVAACFIILTRHLVADGLDQANHFNAESFIGIGLYSRLIFYIFFGKVDKVQSFLILK